MWGGLVTGFGQYNVAVVMACQSQAQTVKHLAWFCLFLLLCHHCNRRTKTACWGIRDHGPSQVVPTVPDEATGALLTSGAGKFFLVERYAF